MLCIFFFHFVSLVLDKGALDVWLEHSVMYKGALDVWLEHNVMYKEAVTWNLYAAGS